MSRVIRFRGKDSDGEWWYGSLAYFQDSQSAHIIPCGSCKNGEVVCDFVEVIPETVGQFTGLYDCNGKEIYDGDIIHLNDEEFELEHGNGIVEFLDKDSGGRPCGGRWYVEDADEDSHAETSLYDLHWEGSLEIIGNRYDTPKLLKIRR